MPGLNPESPVVAVVTQSAVEEMGLAAGTRVTALVKASVVMLTTVVCRPEARAPATVAHQELRPPRR